jgi:hypothetical protein
MACRPPSGWAAKASGRARLYCECCEIPIAAPATASTGKRQRLELRCRYMMGKRGECRAVDVVVQRMVTLNRGGHGMAGSAETTAESLVCQPT